LAGHQAEYEQQGQGQHSQAHSSSFHVSHLQNFLDGFFAILSLDLGEPLGHKQPDQAAVPRDGCCGLTVHAVKRA